MKLIITSILVIMSYNMQAQQAKQALLVIDVQENLLKPSSRIHVDPGSVDSLCISVNRAINVFKQKDRTVIYITNEWTNPIMNFLTGNVCKKGAKGTGIDPRINRINEDIYKKSRANALSNDSLLRYLRTNGITELTLCGVLAEACIKQTLIHGIKKGFTVTVLQEAIGSKNSKTKSRSINYYKSTGASVLNIDQL